MNKRKWIMDQQKKRWVCLPPRAGLLLVAALLLVPGAATGTDVTVNCPTDSLQAAIGSLGPQGPHTIRVTGTCTENILIDQRTALTIAAPENQTGTLMPANPNGRLVRISASHGITLVRLVMSGGRGVLMFDSQVAISQCRVENSSSQGIFASNSILTIETSTVRNNAGRGISALGHSTLTVPGDVIVENNGGGGIRVGEGSVATFDGFTPQGNIIRNNLTGLSVSFGSVATLNGRNTIQNNTVYGIQSIFDSTVDIFDDEDENGTPLGTVVEGNGGVGLVAAGSSSFFLQGSSKIRNNGAGQNVDPFYRSSGILITNGSSVFTQEAAGPGPEITNNLGPGILIDPSASIAFRSTTVNNNATDGIHLAHLSAAESLGGNTVSGNGGAAVTCDQTSVLFGDLTGISPIQCAQSDRRPPAPALPGASSLRSLERGERRPD